MRRLGFLLPLLLPAAAPSQRVYKVSVKKRVMVA